MKMRRLKKILFLLIISIIALAGCGESKTIENEKSTIKDGEKLTVSFINIGKGDAFLIDAPGDGYYLCDTGKDQDFAQIARLLKVKGVEKLKGIFLSHGHKDHAGGLESLVKTFKTEKIYISALDTVSYESIDAKEIANENEIDLVELKGGEKLSLGSANVEVWIPDKVDKKNANNNSVVLRITYGDTAYLMTGDMEKEEEAKFLTSGVNPQADVLKLGHHGEDDATTVNLLQKVKPKYGIICGNMEENPDSMNQEIAERLKSHGVAAYYSEGEQLAVNFVSDGTSIKVENIIDEEAGKPSNISFGEVNRKSQYFTIRNNGDKAEDLSGYVVISEKDDEYFFLPKGTVIEPKKEIVISCEDSSYKPEGCLIWDEDSVWNLKKTDIACLYNNNFILIDKNTK